MPYVTGPENAQVADRRRGGRAAGYAAAGDRVRVA